MDPFKGTPLFFGNAHRGFWGLELGLRVSRLRPKPCNYPIVKPIKLETGLRPNSAGIPYTLLLRMEAIGFPTFRLLL